jgi:hypothetical protein
MLFALVVMAGVLPLAMVVNNRREPSRWESRVPLRKRRFAADRSARTSGADSGGGVSADCSSDGGGGGCDGGGGGGGSSERGEGS